MSTTNYLCEEIAEPKTSYNITMTADGKELVAQQYFPEAEWRRLAAIEKNRATNILRNYRFLLAQGISAKPPDFILRYKARLGQLGMAQAQRSQTSFGMVPTRKSGWDGSSPEALSYDAMWGRVTDATSNSNLFCDSGELLNGNMCCNIAAATSTETCLKFCQYCYLMKQLKNSDFGNKIPSIANYCTVAKDEKLSLKSPNKASFKCFSCGCQLLNKAQLAAHLKGHTGEEKPQCDVCGQKFAKLKYLKNHLKRFSNVAANDRPYKCSFCSHAFVHDKNRKFHERIHSRKRVIPCCHCNQVFPNVGSARNHIEKVHQNKFHQCNVCGMDYSNSSHLLRHMREVGKDYSYQCSICGHKYSSIIALNRHKYQHTRPKAFKCSTCLKTFSSKNHLKRHQSSRGQKSGFECSQCKVKFLALKSLRKHERVFSGDRPFKCPTCGHTYNTKARLTIHMKVHLERNNDEQCFSCGEAFLRKMLPNTHLHLHSGRPCCASQSVSLPEVKQHHTCPACCTLTGGQAAVKQDGYLQTSTIWKTHTFQHSSVVSHNHPSIMHPLSSGSISTHGVLVANGVRNYGVIQSSEQVMS